jgi:hypothetical protein
MAPRITPQTSYDALPAMLTIEEVAIWLHRNPKALSTAVKQGKAPFSARKIGYQWRVSKSQLQEKPIERIFKR